MYPAAFQPAQVFTGSATPAACWASSMRLALTGAAFALFHARCRHSAKAVLQQAVKAYLDEHTAPEQPRVAGNAQDDETEARRAALLESIKGL